MMYSSMGAYVSFETRNRERIVAGLIGAILGACAAGVACLYLIPA